MFDQTWWNNNLQKRYNEYLNWLGDSHAESRQFIKKYIKDNNISSMIDIGCGPALEYYNLINDNYNILYLGVDSCIHIKELHEKNNVPFLFSNVEDIQIDDNSYTLSYSRHVLEHLPTYKTVLDNMIRLSKKYIINIFFIKPGDKEIINLNTHENIYHNTYSKIDIEEFIKSKKVSNYKWVEINEKECALIIEK